MSQILFNIFGFRSTLGADYGEQCDMRSDLYLSRPRFKLWSLEHNFPPKAIAKLRHQQAKSNGLIKLHMDDPLLMDCLKTKLSEQEKKERLSNLLKKTS